MIPVCCVCGIKAPKWHDPTWEDEGGLQDFCPFHAKQINNIYGCLTEYPIQEFNHSQPG